MCKIFALIGKQVCMGGYQVFIQNDENKKLKLPSFNKLF